MTIRSADLGIHAALLAGVSAGLSQSADPEATLLGALAAARDTLGYRSLALVLFPPGLAAGGTAAHYLATQGGATRAPTGDPSVSGGLIGLAARTCESVVCQDTGREPRYVPRSGERAAAAQAALPLMGEDGNIVGALAADSEQAHAFSELDVRTLTSLADQFAASVVRWQGQRADAARAAEQARLQRFNESIVQGVQEGLVVTDHAGAITFANRRFETMLGYEPGSLAGLRWHALVPGAWRSRLPAPEVEEARFECRLTTRGGHELAVQVSLQARHADDAPVGHLLVFTDITQRIRAERVGRAIGDAGLALQTADGADAIVQALERQANPSGLKVALSLVDPTRGTLTVRFAALPPRGIRAVERALAGRLLGLEVPLSLVADLEGVVETRQPVLAPPEGIVAALLPVHARSLVSRIRDRLGLGPTIHAPMLLGSQVMGVASVSHPDLTADDIAVVTAFASQATSALDRARLYDETVERQRQVAVLAESAQRLAATADLDELARGITDQLARVFQCESAGLFIYDETRQMLELAAAPGFTEEERSVAEATAWARHPGWVIRHKLPILSGDTTQDPRIIYIGSRPRFSSVMYVPLLIEGGRALGALNVASRRPYWFKPGDLALMTTLADQVAVAVANALRVREASGRAEQLERVSLACRRIAAHLDLPDLLERSVTEAAHVFDVTHASLYVLDAAGQVAHAAHHPYDEALVSLEGDGLHWLVELTNPVAVTDLRDTEQLRGFKLPLVERGVHSVLVAPIQVDDVTVGGLLMYATEGRRSFGRSSQELARILAGQVTVALDNSRLHQATVAAKSRHEAVVEASFTALLSVNRDGAVVEANRAAADLLGASVDDLTGRALDEVLGAPLWLAGEGPMARARSGSEAEPVELLVPEGTGRSEREVLLGVAELPDGYLVAMADITRLKELDRLKSELVANVSHELRSPLASIKAYTELLLDGLVPDPQTYERFLTVIDTQADRLGQCVSNLLDLARVESEGYRIRPETFGLDAFVGEAVDTVHGRAAIRGITFHVSPLPPGVQLLGDRPLLLSSLKNLLDNAVKYSPVGASVRVDVRIDTEGIAIGVKDRGPGIAEYELTRIFDRFYRVATSQVSGTEGSGLGLVIARQAARVHGGDIRVESQVGVGCTFTIVLPARAVVGPGVPALMSAGAE